MARPLYYDQLAQTPLTDPLSARIVVGPPGRLDRDAKHRQIRRTAGPAPSWGINPPRPECATPLTKSKFQLSIFRHRADALGGDGNRLGKAEHDMTTHPFGDHLPPFPDAAFIGVGNGGWVRWIRKRNGHRGCPRSSSRTGVQGWGRRRDPPDGPRALIC